MCVKRTTKTGDGAEPADFLSRTWRSLDPEEYPGAGPDTLTAGDRIDPLLAFAYDAVFVAAAAAGVAQDEIVGSESIGFAPDLCV